MIIMYYIGENFTLSWTSEGKEDISVTTFIASLDKYSDFFQFRFVQLDHRGGFCDCWAVADLIITYQGYKSTLK